MFCCLLIAVIDVGNLFQEKKQYMTTFINTLNPFFIIIRVSKSFPRFIFIHLASTPTCMKCFPLRESLKKSAIYSKHIKRLLRSIKVKTCLQKSYHLGFFIKLKKNYKWVVEREKKKVHEFFTPIQEVFRFNVGQRSEIFSRRRIETE